MRHFSASYLLSLTQLESTCRVFQGTLDSATTLLRRNSDVMENKQNPVELIKIESSRCQWKRDIKMIIFFGF